MPPTESTDVTRQSRPGQHHQPESTAEIQSAPEDTRCSECSGRLVQDATTQEQHCEDCGIVIENSNLDRGPEWRNFEDRPNRSRVGPALTETRHDRGLSTNIGWKDRDGHGRPLSPEQKRKMRRLRKQNNWSKTKNSKERYLRKAIGEILRMKSALGLPDSVGETATVIYRRATNEDLLRGHSVEGITSAAIYISARLEKIPRTFEEIEPVSRVGIDEIRREQTRLRRELNIGIEPADPGEYIPRYSSNLGVDQKVEAEAQRLCEEFMNSGHASGHDPSSVAAAALYTANLRFDQDLTQATIGDSCQTTPVTIRKTTRLLIDADSELDLTLEDVEGLQSSEIAAKLHRSQE